jgi:hypothetical protein
MTELGLDAEGLTESVLYFNLEIFCFVLFCFYFWVIFFCFFSPLMRQQQNLFSDTNTRTGGWSTNTKIIKSETLLHLNLGIFLLLLSSLCLSNACWVHHWLVHYLLLFISLALYLCVCVCVCVCLFGFFFSLVLYLLCFPSPLTLPL